jgi:undecaprenyl pyrophosphate phosphatase UppP
LWAASLFRAHLESAKQKSQRVILRSIEHVEDLSPKEAMKVGFAQCAALIPGTSRSGATIIGDAFVRHVKLQRNFLSFWQSL